MIEVFFFPMFLHGHMIPMLDIAKLFASRGVRSTIITTPLNVPFFSKSVERVKDLGYEMSIRTIKFPKVDGLPEGCENGDKLTTPEMFQVFFKATFVLQEQLEQLLQDFRPDCLVSDMFFPWTTDSAAKFDIPRLVFHGTSFFAVCASEQVRMHKPFENLSDDSEPFLVPNIPHEIKLIRSQIPPHQRAKTDFTDVLAKAHESMIKSYGEITNTFYELEPDYVEYYRNVMKRKAWHIGPVSLCNRKVEEKAERGKKSAIDEHECLKWLDGKDPSSVIYVCFGSVCSFPSTQLYELAMGLEASGRDFIWVVKKVKNGEQKDDWIPEGFEERIKGKGLVIRGWAPQVLILDHEAIGGFVTHCGWNSTLEGISAGVPMVTWPTFAEQFYNEKLVTEILRIGVAVGAREWVQLGADGVKREAVEAAVKRVMVGDEAEEMRNRAKELKEMAKRAVGEGGSSYSSLDDLIKELETYHS
uniref:Glycosyltransferase n=1 Tax=Centella asiatica TaxID=48106 RepID=A0A2I7M6E3_CENAS|nr:UDP-glucosyltransferase 73A22 [Centella asiatica]